MTNPQRPTLLLATDNPGKLAELRALLPRDVHLVAAREAGVRLPPETGGTFLENAELKARAAAFQSGMLALADDSGLEVDALGGQPGVRSARYAGEPANSFRNRGKLLNELAGVPPDRRQGRFVCAMVLAGPHRLWASVTGDLRGTIGLEERGTRGFGYDSVFHLPDGRTLAELLDEEKNTVSHRAVALNAMLPAILLALSESAHKTTKTP